MEGKIKQYEHIICPIMLVPLDEPIDLQKEPHNIWGHVTCLNVEFPVLENEPSHAVSKHPECSEWGQARLSSGCWFPEGNRSDWLHTYPQTRVQEP